MNESPQTTFLTTKDVMPGTIRGVKTRGCCFGDTVSFVVNLDIVSEPEES